MLGRPRSGSCYRIHLPLSLYKLSGLYIGVSVLFSLPKMIKLLYASTPPLLLPSISHKKILMSSTSHLFGKQACYRLNVLPTFFKYWQEAFISEVQLPKSPISIICHITMINTHQRQNRHMYEVQTLTR